MTRDFFKSFLRIGGQTNQPASAPQRREPLVVGSDERVQIGRSQTVFAPGVIGGFDLDWPQSHHRGAGDDSYLLPVYGRGKPFAQIFLGVGNRKRCHRRNIA